MSFVSFGRHLIERNPNKLVIDCRRAIGESFFEGLKEVGSVRRRLFSLVVLVTVPLGMSAMG